MFTRAAGSPPLLQRMFPFSHSLKKRNGFWVMTANVSTLLLLKRLFQYCILWKSLQLFCCLSSQQPKPNSTYRCLSKTVSYLPLVCCSGAFESMDSLIIGSQCNVMLEHHHTSSVMELHNLTMKTFSSLDVRTRGQQTTTIRGVVMDMRSGARITSNDLRLEFTNLTMHSASEISVSEGRPDDLESGKTLFMKNTSTLELLSFNSVWKFSAVEYTQIDESKNFKLVFFFSMFSNVLNADVLETLVFWNPSEMSFYLFSWCPGLRGTKYWILSEAFR